MSSIDIAIKLGSNEIIIYRKGIGIVAKEPAFLAVQEKGKSIKIKAVGKLAEKLFLSKSSDVVIYQPIENSEILDAKKASILIGSILDNALEDRMVATKLNILVAVPSAVSEDNLLIIKKILFENGASNVEFVQNAVCVHAYLDYPVDSRLAVVDIGKYLTDISILNANSFDFGRVYKIGGSNMDKSITTFILDNHELEVSDLTSENIKNEIASLYVRDLYKTKYVGINADDKFVYHDITASEVMVAIKNVYDIIFEKINEVIDLQTKEIKTELLVNGVVFVGGASKIAGLFEYAMTKLNYPIIIPEVPEDAVILGAGKLLNQKNHLKIKIK